jgi:alkyl hydroperoxide reductase subunit AhpC
MRNYLMKNIFVTTVLLLVFVGCSSPETENPFSSGSLENSHSRNASSEMAGKRETSVPAFNGVRFKDQIESNVPIPQSVKELEFTSKNGQTLKLSDFIGQKYVVLVFTQGFDGTLCPFCTTQTSRLVANYQEFVKRDCEVIVVYPGPDEHVDKFVTAALKKEKQQVDRVPFPIVLDRDFTATDYFDIHSMHAHPSTYLIDRNGGVQFAYVGADRSADRPSIKAMLTKLDDLRK